MRSMKLQTKIQAVTNIWLLTLVASFVLLFVWKSGWRFALFAFIALFFFALGYIILFITHRHIVKKVSPLLLNDCDPEKFLGAVYASMPPGRPKRPQYIWTMLLYEGHYAAGRYADALDELIFLSGSKRGLTNSFQKAGYQLNLAEVSTALGKLEEAGQALERCKLIFEHDKIYAKLKDSLQKTYRFELYKQQVAQSNDNGAEAVFKERFAEAQHEYNRVGAKYHLALFFQHTGKAEKAKEAFEYVVAHGNRLHIAALAREQLGLPPQPGVARLWQRDEA